MYRFLLVAYIVFSVVGQARDPSQWSQDPHIRNWFQRLMRPDQPLSSCCGEADSFESDSYEVVGDHYIAIITDGYGVWPNGTRVEVPMKKVNTRDPNPTGHGYLFLRVGTLEVFCYAPPASG